MFNIKVIIYFLYDSDQKWLHFELDMIVLSNAVRQEDDVFFRHYLQKEIEHLSSESEKYKYII